jgi:hypothetical protein
MCLLWSMNCVFISQKTTFFIVTAVKTSNLTRYYWMLKWLWLKGSGSLHCGKVRIRWPEHAPRMERNGLHPGYWWELEGKRLLERQRRRWMDNIRIYLGMTVWGGVDWIGLTQTNSMTFSPQANYTDWATATCWRNLVPTFEDRVVSWGQRGRSRTDVNLSYLDRSRYFSF